MAETSDLAHRLVAPALVGRDGELRRAVGAVTAAPALVVVAGEAGIGKTRLVGELTAAAARAGRRVLAGRCHSLREPFPLGPVIEAVRGLGDRLGELDLSPVAGALRPFLPELAHALPPPPEPLGDRAAERHRVFRGFVEVLVAAGPTVLVLEDLHWAEEQTGDFVGYLLAEAQPDLAVVVTYRPESVDPRVRALAAGLPPGTTLTDVPLTPLGTAEVGALAAAILGVDAVSDEFASYLHERTSGLPFAVEELVALLRQRGTLVHRRGGWARRALDELDVPTRIRDSVLERVARLGPSAGQVAEAAAVLQLPVPLSLLAATAPLERSEALRAVGEALESGVLTEHGDAVGFRHPLAAQAVYEDLSSPRRLLLHDRAATALAAAAPTPPGQLAHHLRHAGRLDEWVDAAERAAEQAFGLSNDAEAVRLLEDVLRHAPATPERRGRLAVMLGEAAVEAGRAQEAAELLGAVLDEDLPAPLRGELRFRLGGLLHDAGTDLLRAHQLFADAVDDLGHRPDLQAWAMIVLGLPMAGGADPAEHRAWLRRALTVVPQIPDPAFQVFLLGKIAMVQLPTGDPSWQGTADRVERQTSGGPHHRREINAYWSIGTQATYAGHHLLADRLLGAGLAAAAGGERVELRMERSLRSGLVLLRYCQGSWDGLADDAAVLMEELAGNPRARIDGEAAAACLALARGDLDAASAALTAVIELADELSGFDLLPIPVTALLRLAVARGEADAVLARADRLLAAAEPKGVLAPTVRSLPAVAEALVAAGGVPAADRAVRSFAARLDGLDVPLAPAAVAHAEGFVRLGADDLAGAADRFTAAAERYAGLRAPYEAAQAGELAATARLTSSPSPDSPDAGAALLAALAAYRGLGAEWDAGRATAAARRHGLSVPARHRGGRRGYGSELSPREREVAELAAKGRSNREIAEELYLSVNTVARHITTAMRKLGVRSRSAIAHRLDQN